MANTYAKRVNRCVTMSSPCVCFLVKRQGIFVSFVICSKMFEVFLFDGLVKLDILLAGLESFFGDGFPY